ncbi:hypothetical protein SEA_MAGRITTE_179 [Microbacterium phage Magritte]|nr:hypothetical protein SEA_MAGRITTE_179 [Microbacterium phage Magritte]
MTDIVWQSAKAAELMEKDTSYAVEFSPSDRLPFQEWPTYGHYPTQDEAEAMADSMLTNKTIDATRVRKVIA